MTSQSPRIYTYKITFEEVPYYYYGVHKEKMFDEYYMGSPITHKWMWDFYTSKKQILEVFPFTDESWLEAQEVEKRLIKPVFNADKWCLNQNCGGVLSLDTCSRGGKKGGNKNKENGTGIFKLSAEERKEVSKKAGRIGGKITGQKNKELGLGFFKMSFEEKSQLGKRNAEENKKNKTGLYALTQEQRSENAKKGGDIAYKMSAGVHNRSKEQMTEDGKKGGKIGGKKSSSQKWMCEETGYVTNAGALTHYQRARNIDTSKRTRIS